MGSSNIHFIIRDAMDRFGVPGDFYGLRKQALDPDDVRAVSAFLEMRDAASCGLSVEQYRLKRLAQVDKPARSSLTATTYNAPPTAHNS